MRGHTNSDKYGCSEASEDNVRSNTPLPREALQPRGTVLHTVRFVTLCQFCRKLFMRPLTARKVFANMDLITNGY
jgi:hypothetical protein